MTEMEIRKKAANYRECIESKLENAFKSIESEKTRIFYNKNEETFSLVFVWFPDNDPFFVLEYGDGDDGDRFYLSDYSTPDEMYEGILKEIKDGE